MSNATQAKLHYNIVVEYTHKLARHMQECPQCQDNAEYLCNKIMYLEGELSAAKRVYADTVARWLSDKPSQGIIPECAHHCPD